MGPVTLAFKGPAHSSKRGYKKLAFENSHTLCPQSYKKRGWSSHKLGNKSVKTQRTQSLDQKKTWLSRNLPKIRACNPGLQGACCTLLKGGFIKLAFTNFGPVWIFALLIIKILFGLVLACTVACLHFAVAVANSVLAGAGLAAVGVVAAAGADVLAHTLLMPAVWRGAHSWPCYPSQTGRTGGIGNLPPDPIQAYLTSLVLKQAKAQQATYCCC